MDASLKHAVSMAVWDVPDVVTKGEPFTIKVGLMCSNGCDLSGNEVIASDSAGVELGRAVLSAPGSVDGVDLCCAEMELVAPVVAGCCTWKVVLAEDASGHACLPYRVNLNVSDPATIAVCVAVTGQDTKAPISDVRIMLRPYRGYTDETGTLVLTVAPGSYVVHATKDRYENHARQIEIASDIDISIELEPSVYVEDYRGHMERVVKERVSPGMMSR